MNRSWKDRDNALDDWEEKCIRGSGKLSGPHFLRNVALTSIHQKLLDACADRIEELELALEASLMLLSDHSEAPRSMAPNWFVAMALLSMGKGSPKVSACIQDVVDRGPLPPLDETNLEITFGDHDENPQNN